MYYVYILQSRANGALYCGHTQDLAERLRLHNDPAYQATKTTKRIRGPWELVWQQAQPSRSAAMAMERRIKKQGVKRYLERAQLVPPPAGLTDGL